MWPERNHGLRYTICNASKNRSDATPIARKGGKCVATPKTRLMPKKAVRRFDVFTEYTRIKYEQRAIEPDRAKGYAIWMAKVIAARKSAETAQGKARVEDARREGSRRMKEGVRVLELGGEQQTAEVFDKLIIRRMGEDFYSEVFRPAVKQAIEQHFSYEKIRDSIREQW